jgi:hypothetical protein
MGQGGTTVSFLLLWKKRLLPFNPEKEPAQGNDDQGSDIQLYE